MIRIDKDHLVVKNDLDQDYEINLKLLNTPSGLEHWLCHMTEKTWFSMVMAKEMVNVCENRFNYEFNGKYQYGEKS